MLKLCSPELLTSNHILDNFNSHEPSLDEWLRKKALRNQVSGGSRCFVVCKDKDVIGYYCLSAGAVSQDIAPKAMGRNRPDPLPILLLGRLAVDGSYHHQGIGQALLRDALLRAVTISENTGVVALLVHALSKRAKQFYISRGFVESPLQSMTLMMSLKTIKIILETTKIPD